MKTIFQILALAFIFYFTALVAWFVIVVSAQPIYPGSPGMTDHTSNSHWYPHWCCNLRDCAPAAQGTVRREDNGWTYLPTGKFIPDNMTMAIPERASLEDKYRPHVCLRQNDTEYGPKGSVICSETKCCFFPGNPQG